ncbi:hypothetical protein [Nostoc sp.]|uniref:hypothetical protein n=1 Tax=Nostoc sp. TaxID=1180 RepID=UPI002FF54A2A
MKKIIFVTGVTRMREGFVCISGLDEKGKFVRPEIHYPERRGIKKEFLYAQGKVVIKPLAKVELEFLNPVSKSLFHTEDWEIDGNIKPKLVTIPTESEKLAILNQNTDFSLESALAEESRSIVIVRSREVPKIEARVWEDKLKCHLSFYDESGDYHSHLPVTDANWLAACKYLWQTDKLNLQARLTKALQGKDIFIRIGITREWKGQVWRQISGVFSVPDWLNGKCFDDLGYDFNDYV